MKNNYKKIIDIFHEFSDFYCKEAEKDSQWFNTFKRMLDNRINNYINFLNFQEILNFFNEHNNWRILDLGCGIGDKSFLLKKLFSQATILGLETINHDDPDHIKHKPHEFYEGVYEKMNKQFGLDLALYDGKNIPSEYGNFDIILLYAVIEHIAPEKRIDFIHSIEKRLKKNGYFIITRCPRRFGLIEFISRNFRLGAHEWVLTKKNLLSLFPKSNYRIKVLKIMNNIPNNYYFSKYFYYPLLIIDKALSFLHWPLATDYFLVVEKKYE